MLSELEVSNFTAFENAKFKFSAGLNVIIGANGAGKSHILKLAYSVAKTSFNQRNQNSQSKQVWQKAIADDLIKIFRPEHKSLGRLARRQQGQSKATVIVKFEKPKGADFSFAFSTRSNTDVQIENDVPSKFAAAIPIFIPTKELLSLFPGLRGLYKNSLLSD